MSEDPKHDQLVDAFVKTLNAHGHAFQYAVLAELGHRMTFGSAGRAAERVMLRIVFKG